MKKDEPFRFENGKPFVEHCPNCKENEEWITFKKWIGSIVDDYSKFESQLSPEGKGSFHALRAIKETFGWYANYGYPALAWEDFLYRTRRPLPGEEDKSP